MDNIVKTIISFSVTGANSAASAIGGVSKAAGVATRTMATLATSLGTMGGSLGKAAGMAGNFMASVMQMGAIGGIMAGAQIAIKLVADHFVEAADKMVAAANKMYDRVHSALDELNQQRMDGLKKTLDEATVKANEAASAFEAMASAYLKVQAAENATASSKSAAGMSALNLEKTRAMAGATSDEARALVGADYDVRIAEAKKRATKEAQDNAVAMAVDESTIAGSRAADSRSRVTKAQKALNEARDIYERDVAGQNIDNIQKSKAAVKEAETALAAAMTERTKNEGEADAAAERVRKAEYDRQAALTDATREVEEARESQRRLKKAQEDEAKAKEELAKAERAAAEAAARKAAADEKARQDQERASRLTGARDQFKSSFNSAFDLWRDPEAAAAAVESDKKRSSDLKAFNKAVNRYGGKGKIDEYAALMRNGDEEGMQSRLEQWRKSSKFTPQVEQMVKAEAARKNETAADRALVNIEKNTANLDKKLDELLQIK